MTGRLLEGPELTADYWWRNVRQTVLFADAMDQVSEAGCTVAVELSPHPVLGSAVADCFRQHNKVIRVLASLRRPRGAREDSAPPWEEEDRPTMLRALAALHTAGRALDWSKVAPTSPTIAGHGSNWVRLPAYPWQRETHWQETEESRQLRLGKGGHPLLGGPCRMPEPTWESVIDSHNRPFLTDHQVQGAMLLPATAYVEMALTAATRLHGPGGCVLEEIRFLKGCFVSGEQARVVRTTYHPEEATFEISSRFEGSGDQPWTTHVRGVLRSRVEKPAGGVLDLDAVKARCPGETTGADCYARLRKVGLVYGPVFQGLRHLWQGDREALALVRAPEGLADNDLEGYTCHPALLDACWQATIGVLPQTHDGSGAIVLPVEVEQVRVHGRLGRELWSHARLVEKNRQGVVSDVRVFNEAGQLLVEVRGLYCQFIAGTGSDQSVDELLYEYQWQLKPRDGQEARDARRGLDYLSGLKPIRQHIAGVRRQVRPATDSAGSLLRL